MRYENTPVWLQNVMAKSGLFTDYIVKMAQVITWWYRGEDGTFTYWPDGPFEPPKRSTPAVEPGRRRAERADVPPRRSGRPPESAIAGLKHRSLFEYGPTTTTGRSRPTASDPPLRPDEIRLLVHWNAEVYADMDEVKKVMDHTDDLTHDRVIATLLADMRGEGRAVAEPSDPFHDDDFIQALISTYTIAPTTDWLHEPA